MRLFAGLRAGQKKWADEDHFPADATRVACRMLTVICNAHFNARKVPEALGFAFGSAVWASLNVFLRECTKIDIFDEKVEGGVYVH